MADGNKTFDEIMQSITSGFTGDPDHDKEHIVAQMEVYKDHELSQEILRTCGRLLWETAPDDLKAEFGQLLDNRRKATDSTLEEAYFNMKMGEPAKALELLEPLAAKLDELAEAGWCADDSESRYFDFRSFKDELVWRAHNDDAREIRCATEPFARTYFALGSCLYEAERYEEAMEACRKAIRWNPADTQLRFELAENYKRMSDMDGYAEVLRELYPYVASAGELARYHRAMGYLHIEIGNFETAAAHLMASLPFEQSPMPLSEIMYIKLEHGQDYTDMTPLDALEILDKKGVAVLANDKTLEALNHLLSAAYKHGDLSTALNAASDLYSLTGDEAYGAIAQKIASMLDPEGEDE